jgi:hypothetical protein
MSVHLHGLGYVAVGWCVLRCAWMDMRRLARWLAKVRP